MRVVTVQWDPQRPEEQWAETAAHGADLVVLPELPFSRWLADSREPSATAWQDSIEHHEEWLARLPELNATVVVGSRPIVADGRRFNESFVWAGELLPPAHRKTYLPDEPGYWEASWYERGPVEFLPVDTPVGRLGVQLCTELWFFGHARELGEAGCELLVLPRATPATSSDKWIAGGRAAAVVSGSFVVSANHGPPMGGAGYVIDPEEGDVLAVTTAERPVALVEVDLERARQARTTYPRYVVTD